MVTGESVSDKVLIVSGEAVHREALLTAVRRTGWKANVCKTVAEAELLLGRESYAAVLCEDTSAEGGVNSAIASLGRPGRRTPVIIVSRRDNWHDYITTLAAGASDYVAFPPYPGEIEQSLGRVAQESMAVVDAV
jgi:two-component system, OmpR family, response regulator